MRFYEVVTPLRAHLAELSVKRGTMTEELDTHRTQMKALMEVLHTHTTTSLYLHLYDTLIFVFQLLSNVCAANLIVCLWAHIITYTVFIFSL